MSVSQVQNFYNMRICSTTEVRIPTKTPCSPRTFALPGKLWLGMSNRPSRLAATAKQEIREILPSEGTNDAYEKCKAITMEFAKTFYFATLFQPEDQRKSVYAIYAWCRTLDEMVDAMGAAGDSMRGGTLASLEDSLTMRSARLDLMWTRPDDLNLASRQSHLGDAAPEELALADTIQRVPGLEPAPFQDMIQGMRADVACTVRYATFPALYTYCYRVAGTVALMTLPVLGTAPGARAEAAAACGVALGVALQLTNIIRDVGEDAARGRIYLPLEDLHRFGLTEDDIMQSVLDSRYKALMAFQIDRALCYYDMAEEGIPMLAPGARLAVKAAAALYRRILEEVRNNGYDNYTTRAFTTKWQKLAALPGLWWETNVATGAVRPSRVNWVSMHSKPGIAIGILIAYVQSNQSQELIEKAAAELVKLEGLPEPAQNPVLLGDWDLLWSSPESDYSKLRRRLDNWPISVRSQSTQSITQDLSTTAVDLSGLVQIQIAATIIPNTDDEAGRRTLVGPPYTFTLCLGPAKFPLEFPAEFGQEHTCVEQLYLSENLRISRVGAYGERTTDGSTFIHIRSAKKHLVA